MATAVDLFWQEVAGSLMQSTVFIPGGEASKQRDTNTMTSLRGQSQGPLRRCAGKKADAFGTKEWPILVQS